MSDFFGKLKAGAGKVAFEADKLARVNRIQSELNQLKRQSDEVYTSLGKAVYQQMVSGESVDLESWRVRIEEQVSRIQAKEAELQAANAEQYNTQPAAQGQQPPAPPTAPYPGETPVPPTAPYASTPPPPAPPYASAPTPPAPYTTTPTPPPAPIPPEPVATTKVCPSCGAELPINSRFCTNCGAKV